MYSKSADIGRMPARRVADPCPWQSLMQRWRAVLRRLHDIACLPELGGCEEELIDTRAPHEQAIAGRG